jgi:nucleoside-diphosphate-sugar epimerase
MNGNNLILGFEDPILITGSNGFIGSRVVETLLRSGFTNLRCFARPESNLSGLHAILETAPRVRVEVMQGNLLSREDCAKAAKDVAVIFHLAAGVEKTFPGCFMNSAVATRNLLDAVVKSGCLRRFVNVGSFSVYSNWNIVSGGLLDETCELESRPVDRAEAYVYAKVKQDQLVMEYGQKYGVPYVILRPGAVYGPGTHSLTARVEIDTFGALFHVSGSSQVPLTYVDNCAEAMVLAGLKPGLDGEAFGVVDNNLPSSRKFLRMYGRHGNVPAHIGCCVTP